MSVEDRLRRLEHREAIKELRARYCYRIDARDWEGFAALFTEDAHLDFGPVGTFDGRDAVREFAEHVVGAQHPFLAHMVHNPVLDVEASDDHGTGRWYFEVPCTFSDGGAGWIQGTYHDTYRLVDGEWRFASVRADFNYFADYDEGWADVVGDE